MFLSSKTKKAGIIYNKIQLDLYCCEPTFRSWTSYSDTWHYGLYLIPSEKKKAKFDLLFVFAEIVFL